MTRYRCLVMMLTVRMSSPDLNGVGYARANLYVGQYLPSDTLPEDIERFLASRAIEAVDPATVAPAPEPEPEPVRDCSNSYTLLLTPIARPQSPAVPA